MKSSELLKDKKGRTGIHRLADAGDFASLRALLGRLEDPAIAVNAPDSYQMRPLHRAILAMNSDEGTRKASYMNVIQDLCECGADLEAPDDQGHTVLLFAATIFESQDLIAYLLSRSVKRDARLPDGTTVLHLAAAKGCVESVQLLVQAEPNLLGAKTKTGETVLIAAVQCHAMSVVRYLLTLKNIKVDEKDKVGDTALHHAAQKADIEMVNLLLIEGKADPSIKNNAGEIAHALYKAGASVPIFLDYDQKRQDKKSSIKERQKLRTDFELLYCALSKVSTEAHERYYIDYIYKAYTSVYDDLLNGKTKTDVEFNRDLAAADLEIAFGETEKAFSIRSKGDELSVYQQLSSSFFMQVYKRIEDAKRMPQLIDELSGEIKKMLKRKQEDGAGQVEERVLRV